MQAHGGQKPPTIYGNNYLLGCNYRYGTFSVMGPDASGIAVNCACLGPRGVNNVYPCHHLESCSRNAKNTANNCEQHIVQGHVYCSNANYVMMCLAGAFTSIQGMQV